jgi:hypothetical protein
MFDREVALSERSRYARLRSGVAQWWEAQLATASSSREMNFALLNLFCWATTRTIVRLSGPLSKLLDDLDDLPWKRLKDFVAKTDNSDKQALTDSHVATKLQRLSPRVLALLALRSHPMDAMTIYDAVLKEYKGTDTGILSTAAELAVRQAINSPGKWKDALSVVRRAYRHDAATERWFLHSDIERVELPHAVAIDISRQAGVYPMRLLELADASLTKLVGSNAKPVGAVAKTECWFG